MARLIFLLSPPRSYSSLISTMIGQHPDIYGFPELNLMMRDTVGECLLWERSCRRFLGSPGLLRLLAEVDLGGQTPENILTAAAWVEDRAHWSSARMMDYVVARTADISGATYCLEKSPSVSLLSPTLEPMRRNWPDALYLHVTRHPMGTKRSLDEFYQTTRRFNDEERQRHLDNSNLVWSVAHRNILEFCASLAPGQYLRIRGEDVLSNAAGVMRQVAQWLGLRDDDAAIDRMMHPETSPYASLGPVNAPFGNDPKFLFSPAFRPGKPRLDGLEPWLASEAGRRLDPVRQDYLRQMAQCLGYT